MSNAKEKLLSELLCLADSKWVLGHWYIKVMLNCRTLTDATAFSGMSQDELGHTRALFRFLEEEYDLPEHQLEFGRERDQIHSMALLDEPPANRGDFMLTAYLAEAALWNFLLTFRNGANEEVAGMVNHFGKESRFHRLSLLGWSKSLDAEDRAQMVDAFATRVPLALSWFGDADADADELKDAGIRSESASAAGAALLHGAVNEIADILSLEVPQAADMEVAWDKMRRRPEGSALPAALWEAMLPSSDEAKLARRPLSISIEDNIDLFDKAG